MTFAELKEELKSYIDDISGENPSERDIEILGYLDDYVEPEAFSEEEINNRINAAVAANTAEWTKKFKDRFYGRDTEPDNGDEQTVEDTEVVTNEPEQEELKSVLDYEW